VDQTYRIFTDGSAIGNPGPGGWGVVVIQGKERWEMSGAHPWTTISEMELVAAVQALRSVEGRARIELHSDSEYLIYGMRAFVFRWQRQGWRNRRGTQLQHRELWTELIELNTSLPIRWKWIKGHSGHRDQIRGKNFVDDAVCVSLTQDITREPLKLGLIAFSRLLKLHEYRTVAVSFTAGQIKQYRFGLVATNEWFDGYPEFEHRASVFSQ
jgi:ribonuclease HI